MLYFILYYSILFKKLLRASSVINRNKFQNNPS